ELARVGRTQRSGALRVGRRRAGPRQHDQGRREIGAGGGRVHEGLGSPFHPRTKRKLGRIRHRPSFLTQPFRRRSGAGAHRVANPAGLRASSPATEAQMRKTPSAALAAVTLAGAVAATTAPAQAQPYRYGGWGGYGYYGGHYHHNDVAGPALAAGILGL